LDAALRVILLSRPTRTGAQKKITDFHSLWEWDLMQNLDKNFVWYAPVQTLQGTKGVCGHQSQH
jgi:hypothetical protein